MEPTTEGDDELLPRLLNKDADAFRSLLRRHHGTMLGLARTYAHTHATAEEVVQDTWLAVIEGLDRFDQRSSLKTWIFAILVNRARTRAARNGRIRLFSELDVPHGPEEPTVDPERFTAAGSWSAPPRAWEEITPERQVAAAEILSHLRNALNKLPASQRAVILLRDVEGCETQEVCNILGISESNCRVLLHRGRAKLRTAMEGLLSNESRRRDTSDA